MLKSGKLTNGGVMVNYRCSAACRHCLYSCSPTREAGYVDEEAADAISHLLKKGGCRSVHIGGGEPFLDFKGLVMMIRKLGEAGIVLDYVETNAFWAAETRKKTEEMLETLLALGASTLCISVDPYHAEYVPYGAPLALAKLCEKTGMEYFLWRQEFLPMLSKMDSRKVYSRPDMEEVFSGEYINNTARLYNIGYGGRAVNIEREFGVLSPAESFIRETLPCHNLLSTGHFHVDKNCCYLPPRCTGIRLPLEEAVDGIPPEKYPVFETLHNGGVSALFEFALRHGFSPGREGYPSKCNFCFYLRAFLAEKGFAELDKDHYEEALKYYWF